MISHKDFIQNKYFDLYITLINNRIKNPVDIASYTENHHILPYSMGGTRAKSNMVRLYAREHFVVHKLLTKCTSGHSYYKMFRALSMFSVNEKRNITFTSRDYATLKTASVIAKTGKRQTIETREKRIKALTGQKRTPEQRKNMSDGQIGLKKPQQHGKNVSKALTGVKHTKDRIERTRLSRIGLKRELITCPHCGYTGGNVGMTRYHFNECKYHSNKIHTLLTKYDSASLAAELFKIRSILIFQQMSSILN